MKSKRIMAFGTFDYLHAGHEHYLKNARELGDELIVVIARDQTAKAVRGEAPDHSEKNRLKAVAALPFVDKAVLGNLENKYKVIAKYKPKIIALGYDQMAFTQQLQKTLIELKLNAKIIRLTPYQPQMYKSSLIRNEAKRSALAESTNETKNEVSPSVCLGKNTDSQLTFDI